MKHGAITKLIELVETAAAHKSALADIEASDAAARLLAEEAREWADLAALARIELADLTR